MGIKTIWEESFKAAADYKLKQFYAMRQTAGTEGSATLCSAVTDRVLGILQNKPDINQAAEIMIMGISKAVSDGTTAIAAGDPLTVDTSGRVVKNATADRPTIGMALQPSTAVGTVIEVMLTGWAGAFRTPA